MSSSVKKWTNHSSPNIVYCTNLPIRDGYWKPPSLGAANHSQTLSANQPMEPIVLLEIFSYKTSFRSAASSECIDKGKFIQKPWYTLSSLQITLDTPIVLCPLSLNLYILYKIKVWLVFYILEIKKTIVYWRVFIAFGSYNWCFIFTWSSQCTIGMSFWWQQVMQFVFGICHVIKKFATTVFSALVECL